jgi:AraC-like DNA-binding protein
MRQKRQGFKGERILELTLEHFEENNSSISQIASFSKIGFFPEAKYHDQKSVNGDEYLSLIYCINGGGEATILDKSYNIRTGDFFFVPTRTPYHYKTDENKPWSIYWFNFKGSIAEQLLKLFYQQNNSYKAYLAYNEERIQLFDIIYKSLKRGYSKENLQILNIALIHFLSSSVFNLKQKNKTRDKTQDIINNSIEFMKKNYDTHISLEKLAQQANISVPHYSSIFKKKTSVSPIDYFNQIKIQKACQFLKHTDILIKEVAFKVGLEDAQYFSRIFSKIKGVSPKKYRNNHHKS